MFLIFIRVFVPFHAFLSSFLVSPPCVTFLPPCPFLRGVRLCFILSVFFVPLISFLSSFLVAFLPRFSRTAVFIHVICTSGNVVVILLTFVGIVMMIFMMVDSFAIVIGIAGDVHDVRQYRHDDLHDGRQFAIVIGIAVMIFMMFVSIVMMIFMMVDSFTTVIGVAVMIFMVFVSIVVVMVGSFTTVIGVAVMIFTMLVGLPS